MTITLRVDKGAPLTISELDGNFQDLDGRTTTLEDVTISARSIETITQVGNSLIVEYNDSTTDGPFTFDVTINFRGDWEPETIYSVNDLVHVNGIIYIVLNAHESGTVFDPGDGESGADFYSAFLQMPELTIPVGGGEGYVLTKVSDDDYDYQWVNAGVPTAGLAGAVLTKVSSDDYDTAWVSGGGSSGVSDVFEIDVDTLDIDDGAYSSKYMRCTHASGCTVTILPDDEIEFAVATEFHFRQSSANPVIIVAGSSTAATVVLSGPTGYEMETAVEGAVITVKKIAANMWDVFGLLAASSA
jgi:hypothetical protein